MRFFVEALPNRLKLARGRKEKHPYEDQRFQGRIFLQSIFKYFRNLRINAKGRNVDKNNTSDFFSLVAFQYRILVYFGTYERSTSNVLG